MDPTSLSVSVSCGSPVVPADAAVEKSMSGLDQLAGKSALVLLCVNVLKSWYPSLLALLFLLLTRCLIANISYIISLSSSYIVKRASSSGNRGRV